MRSRLDRRRRDPDGRAVFDDLFAGRNGASGELVPQAQVRTEQDMRSIDKNSRAGWQRRRRDENIVGVAQPEQARVGFALHWFSPCGVPPLQADMRSRDTLPTGALLVQLEFMPCERWGGLIANPLWLACEEVLSFDLRDSPCGFNKPTKSASAGRKEYNANETRFCPDRLGG